jgi:hypothetical protein
MASFFDYNDQLSKHSVNLADLESMLVASRLISPDLVAQIMDYVLGRVTDKSELPGAVGPEGMEWES